MKWGIAKADFDKMPDDRACPAEPIGRSRAEIGHKSGRNRACRLIDKLNIINHLMNNMPEKCPILILRSPLAFSAKEDLYPVGQCPGFRIMNPGLKLTAQCLVKKR